MASAAAVALSASSAFAQAADPWQGFYAGVNANYIDSKSYSADSAGKWFAHGGGGGIQAGFNESMPGFVWGGEADADYNDVSGTSDPFFGGKKLNSRLDWTGSVRVRGGIPFSDVPIVNNMLVYGTGGLAIGQWRERFSEPSTPSDTAHKTDFGWTLGGGVEFPVGDNMSLKAEYLYADYGRKSYDLTAGPYKIHNWTNTFRIGLNWHFDP